jgi:hypothetical protein
MTKMNYNNFNVEVPYKKLFLKRKKVPILEEILKGFEKNIPIFK